MSGSDPGKGGMPAMSPAVVVVALALLMGIQPITTDLYLPALPLLARASAGAPDVAAAAARALGRCRPADTTPPARVRTVFGPVLDPIEAVAA